MSNLDPKEIKRYFEQQAEAWLESSYRVDGNTFPVGLHRARIIGKVLAEDEKPLRVLDLGCGGGKLSLYLASLGHQVVGVDQSEAMLTIATRDLAQAQPELRGRVRFINASIDKFTAEEKPFDAVVAMGLIGYLPNNEMLFELAGRHLLANGRFLLSCRNRLFNMTSLTWRTMREINSGHAPELLYEIDALYGQTLPEDAVQKLSENLTSILGKINANAAALSDVPTYAASDISIPESSEARQHTPSEIARHADAAGFSVQQHFAIHPHIFNPRFERLLPAVMANKMAEAMTVFEAFPASLPLSSVFVTSMRRK